MSTLPLALLIKPFVALIVFGLICLPVRLAIQRYMKPGKLKDLLLTRLRD